MTTRERITAMNFGTKLALAMMPICVTLSLAVTTGALWVHGEIVSLRTEVNNIKTLMQEVREDLRKR
jgi:hypothetical protein